MVVFVQAAAVRFADFVGMLLVRRMVSVYIAAVRFADSVGMLSVRRMVSVHIAAVCFADFAVVLLVRRVMHLHTVLARFVDFAVALFLHFVQNLLVYPIVAAELVKTVFLSWRTLLSIWEKADDCFSYRPPFVTWFLLAFLLYHLYEILPVFLSSADE